MKIRPLFFAAPLLFVLGALAGREFFATDPAPAAEEPPLQSERSERKKRTRPSSPAGPSIATATGIAGLLDLIDPTDPFTTSTRLRASLQEMPPTGIEALLLDLGDQQKNHPGFHTLRLSLLNHLVAKAPFSALAMILEHPDRSFRTSGLSYIMKGVARLGADAVQEAIALIEDPRLKELARSTALAPNPDSTPQELLALLKSGTAQVPVHFGGGFPSSYIPWGSSYWGSHSGIPNFSFHSNSANGALSQLAQKDLASAEAYAVGLDTEPERRQALLQIAQGLTQEDPNDALEWVRRQDSQTIRDQAMITILSSLAANDPARAAGLIGEIENIHQRGGSIGQIASLWAHKDPQAAISWAKNLPPTNARLGALATIAQQLVQSDPRTAIDLIETLPGQSRQQLLPNLINQWSVQDFEGARDWVTSQQDPVLFQDGLASLIGTWTQKDPTEAAAFLQEAAARQPGSSNFRTHLSALARQWAGQDRDTALAWARSLENEKDRVVALAGVHNEWTASDPAGAARHLTTVTDPGVRTQLLNGIATTLSAQDPEAARAWMNTLPADDRFTATQSAISALRYQDPEQAAELYDQITREAGGDENKLNTISRQANDIASQWANHSPQDAAGWAAGISNEEHRANAYRNIASQWAQTDPAGAARWLDELPQGKPRDEATGYFVQNIRQYEPATAFAWADTIGDESARYRALRDAVNQWHNIQPEAAKEAISSANLGPEKREELIQQLR